MAKLYDEELIAIIKSSYENGASISKLSKNHNVPTGTIKTWSSKWGWTKKKPNQTTKPQTTNKKVVEKDTKIKSDILKGKSREEVMKENGISNTTYFRKKNSIREMVVERNKKIFFLKSVDKINFIWYTICVKLNSTMKIEYEKKI